MEDGYIQIGETAQRDPITGDYLPSVPLYIKADSMTRAQEESLISDIGKLLADRMRRYKAACEAAGVAI
jgi:hypothetical protein